MISFTWYLLGFLSTASVIFLFELSSRYTVNWKAWIGLGCGIVLVLFSMAWGVGTVLEGVPRAGSMGILLFGLPGIIFFTSAFRYSTQRLKKRQLSDDKPDKAETRDETPVSLKTVTPAVKDRSGIWSIVRYGAFGSLIVAYITGIIINVEDYESLIRSNYADLELQKINDDPVVFQVGENITGKGEYILIQEGQGYGGPFVFGIRIKDDAKIHEAIPLADKETPAFTKKIKEANFRDQFINRSVSDNFLVGDDIDVVSGATVTTIAATEAVREAAHFAAVNYFNLERTWAKIPWKFGHKEILLFLLFILAFFPQFNKAPWKHLYIAVTIGVVGFYLNSAISVGSFASLLMGYLPSAREHLIWWILVFGTVATIILLGKNVYCFKICPFYGIQFVLNKISGNRFNPTSAFLKHSKMVANFLLWLALLLIFLLQLPSVGAFEPFAMMFSLEGVGIQWYILPLSIIGSFFMSLFWCRFFCPAGKALSWILKSRKKVISLLVKKASSTER